MEALTPLQDRGELDVLLVEDDPGDAVIIREALRTPSIEQVQDGEQALRYLRREDEFAGARRPDLVLLDLNMPRKDGREVLAEVKSDRALCSIPIVVLTTSYAQEDIDRSYALHANAYVTKPTDFDDFVAAVARIEGFFGDVAQRARG
jgi:CheY-like chemotaxis protein